MWANPGKPVTKPIREVRPSPENLFPVSKQKNGHEENTNRPRIGYKRKSAAELEIRTYESVHMKKDAP